MKKISCALFLLALFFSISVKVMAQGVGTHVTMLMQNITQPSANTIQFDLIAISDGDGSHILVPSAFQIGINYDTLILQPGDSIQKSYVGGSSDFIPPLSGFNFPGTSFKDHIRIVEGAHIGNTNDTMVLNQPYRIGSFLLTSGLPWVQNSQPHFSLQAYAAGGHTTTAAIMYVDTDASSTSYAVTGTGDGQRAVGVTDSITLNITCTMTPVTSATPVSCYGGNDGTASVSVTGGTPPYTYFWSDGESTPTTVGVVAGYYTVVVTDAGGCTSTAAVTVPQPAGPVFSCYLTNEVQTSPATYQFDLYLLNTSTSVFEYAAGQWGITVNPVTVNGGTLTASVIAGSSDLSNSSQVPNNVVLNNTTMIFNIGGRVPPGSGNGSIISDVDSGGCARPGTRIATFEIANTVPFTSNSRMKHHFNFALGSGMTQTKIFAYICGLNTDITSIGSFFPYDTSGTCLQNIQLNPAACVLTDTATSTDASCLNGNNGTASVTASGGVAPFDYSWSNGQTLQSINSLMVGGYSVTVTDAVGCTATASVTITSPPTTMNISATSNSPVCTGSSINFTSNVQGGSAPYNYLWTGPNGFLTSSPNPNIATSIPSNSGTYTLMITDFYGCNPITTTTVVVGTPPDTTVFLIGDTLMSNFVGGSYQWINCDSNQLISAATNQMIRPAHNGFYKVQIVKDGCTVTSGCHFVFLLDVPAFASDKGFTIAPNPNDGFFTIQMDGAVPMNEKIFIQVFDVFGRVVYEDQAIIRNHHTIDLKGQVTGIYLIKVVVGEREFKGKVMLSRN